MRQLRVVRVMAIGFLLAGVGACATMRPPATSSGPAMSSNGVQIAVVRQICAESQPVGPMLGNWVDETVEVQVRNGSPQPVAIHLDRFRLLGPDGGVLASGADPSIEPLAVARGETRTVEVRFSSRGGLECTRPMRLDAGAGITSGEAPVVLGLVSFVPSRAL
jgi:hypothetical protein